MCGAPHGALWSGTDGLYRVKVSRVYRVLYQVEDDELLVLVLRARHRKTACKGM